jgi:hypothetical protein
LGWGVSAKFPPGGVGPRRLFFPLSGAAGVFGVSARRAAGFGVRFFNEDDES